MDEEKVKQEAEALLQHMQTNPSFATFITNNTANATPHTPSTSPVADAVLDTTSQPTVSVDSTSTDTKTETKQSKDDKKKYGKYTKEDFIDRDGDLILRNDFLRNIRFNADRFISSLPNHYNQQQRTSIREAINDLYEGIKNKTINPTGLGQGDVLKNADRIKNTEKGFDAYGLAYKFIDEVFNKQKSWTNPDADKPEDLFSADSFAKALNKELFGGRDSFDENFWGQDPWDATNKIRSTKNRTALVVEKLQKLRNDVVNGTLFGDSDDSQKSTTLGYIDQAIKALADGEVSEQDRLVLSNLGIDYDQYFGTREKYGEEEESTSDNKTDEEKEWEAFVKEQQSLQRREYMDTVRAQSQWKTMADSREDFAQFKSNTNNFWNLYNQLNDTSLVDSEIRNSLNIISANMREGKKNPLEGVSLSGRISIKKGNQSIQLYNRHQSWSERLDSILQAAYKLRDKINRPVTKDGHLIIATDKSGMAYCYDPVSHRVYKRTARFVLDSSTLESEFNDHYGIPSQPSNGMDSAVVSQKQGGVLKYFIGGSVAESQAMFEDAIARAQALKEQEAQTKKKQLEDNAAKSGRTVKQYQAGQREVFSGDLKTEDYTRLAAIGADIAALASSFVPVYGTAVSAAASLTSTGLDLFSDFKDPSVSSSQAWKNLGMNLGLSAAALIPGGGTAKIIKNVARYAPLLLSAATLMDSDVQKSVNKLTSDEKITVDDLKNIGRAISAVTGSVQAGKSIYQAKKYNNLSKQAKTGDIEVRTKDGSTVKITQAQKEEIDATGFKEGTAKANEKFKEITKQITGQEHELSAEVNYKSKGIFKGIRSKTLKGQDIFGDLTEEGAFRLNALEQRANTWAQKAPWLSRWANTDYDIYRNGDFVFKLPSWSFGYDSRAWKQYVKNRPAAPNNPPSNPPSGVPQGKAKQNFMFQQLPDNTKVANLNVKNPDGSFKYKNADGTLNDKGIAILDRIMPNWRNNQYTGTGVKKWYNDKIQNASFTSVKTKPLTENPKNSAVGNGWVAFWKQGSKIEQAKELSKKKFAKGGIIKFQTGGWFSKLYKTGEGFQNLINWDKNLDNSLAGSTIRENGHSNAGNLDLAFRKNQAYTMVSDDIGNDIQSFYGEAGNNTSDINEFVRIYNDNAKKIRDFWNTAKTYTGQHDEQVKAHNQLFKKMFKSRSGSGAGLHNIGYQEKDDKGNLIDDIMGSSTWLRRMDRYETDFENDTEEHQRRRIHKIALGDGKEVYVYKKADGDIDVLDVDKYKHLLTKAPIVATPNTDATKIVGEPGSPEAQKKAEELATTVKEQAGKIHGIDVTPDNNNSALAKAWALKLASPLMDIDRFARTLKTNKDVKKIWDKVNHPVLQDTYERFSPVTGDFLGMQVMSRANADRMRAIQRAGQRAQEQNLAMFLEGQQANTQNSYVAAQHNDDRVRETAKEALMRQEDNAARWSQVDNTNRQATHQAELAQAQTENDYKIKQNEAFQNFLMGLQNTANNEWTNYQNYITNQEAINIQKKYQDSLNEAQQEMFKDLSEGKSRLNSPGYYKLQEIRRQMEAEIASLNYMLPQKMGIYSPWNSGYHSWDFLDQSTR